MDRFGRLTVVAVRSGTKSAPGRRAECRCDCGASITVRLSSLTSGNTTSCGCYKNALAAERCRARASHQHTSASAGRASPEYRSWKAMRERCAATDGEHFERYAKRGITVCERWRDSFENFLADMGPRPAGTTLDRRDNDGNYEPGNCRWATGSVQSMNQGRARTMVYLGETLNVAEVARRSGIAYATIWTRLDEGWTDEQAVSPDTARVRGDGGTFDRRRARRGGL